MQISPKGPGMVIWFELAGFRVIQFELTGLYCIVFKTSNCIVFKVSKLNLSLSRSFMITSQCNECRSNHGGKCEGSTVKKNITKMLRKSFLTE